MKNACIKENLLEKCPICDSWLNKADSKIHVSDPFSIVENIYTYHKCKTCKAWILNPRPDISEMWRFYDVNFLYNPAENKKSVIKLIAKGIQEFNLRSEVNLVLNYLKNRSSYLDYSAGNGQIISRVSRKYPKGNYFATEFTEIYRKYLDLTIGKNNVKQKLTDFEENQKFDVISAFGILEHVEDPKGLLNQLVNKLNENGILIVTIPNVSSFQRYIFGKRWYNWLAPRHWQMLNNLILEKMLMDEKLKIIGRKNFFLRTCSSTFTISLFPSLDPLKQPTLIKLLIYAFFFYFFIPFELMASIFKRSSFIGVVSIKVL